MRYVNVYFMNNFNLFAAFLSMRINKFDILSFPVVISDMMLIITLKNDIINKNDC